MHSHDVRRRALLAVAKLSIFAGALGCGSGVERLAGEPGGYEDEPAADDGPLPYVLPVAPPVADASCFTASVDAPSCCGDLLTESFADDHLWVDPTLATAEELACCDLVFSTLSTWDGVEPLPFDGALSGSCCAIGTNEPLCTAWGPPMPPPMPPRRAPREVLS